MVKQSLNDGELEVEQASATLSETVFKFVQRRQQKISQIDKSMTSYANFGCSF